MSFQKTVTFFADFGHFLYWWYDIDMVDFFQLEFGVLRRERVLYKISNVVALENYGKAKNYGKIIEIL